MIACVLGITCYADRGQSIDNHPCDSLERIGPRFRFCGPVKRQEGGLRGGIFVDSSISVLLEVMHLHCLMIVRALRSVDYFERWEQTDAELYQRSESGWKFAELSISCIDFLHRMLLPGRDGKFNRW